jgi:hypothetical protein
MLLRARGGVSRRSDQSGDRPDVVRIFAQRVSPLRLAGTLDSHRQRQLFDCHDLSGRPAPHLATKRFARRNLGHLGRGLWRCHSSYCGGPCGHGRCRSSCRAPGDWSGCALRGCAQRAVARIKYARATITGLNALANRSPLRRGAPIRRGPLLPASSAGWSMRSYTERRAACPDRRSGTLSAPSARLRGNPTGSA